MSDTALRSFADPDVALLGADVTAMLERLGGAALIRVGGRDRSRCRAVVTLLHGNEPSGAEAVHAWLVDRERAMPAVDAVFIVASVAAALQPPRFSHRILPGTRDLNRCFLGPFDDASGRLAAAILEAIAASGAECVVDVHNNSGHNPAYAIGTGVDAARLRLAGAFAPRYIHSELRLGSLMEAVTAVPCVTVECGRSGDAAAAGVARAGIERMLGAAQIDAPFETPELLDSMVRVRVRDGIRLAVSDARHPEAEITITHDIDRHNFEVLAHGTVLGWVEPGVGWPVEARDASGGDRSRELFEIDGEGRLRSRGSWTPIMMTTDPLIARQDCLFYVVTKRQLGRVIEPS